MEFLKIYQHTVSALIIISTVKIWAWCLRDLRLLLVKLTRCSSPAVVRSWVTCCRSLFSSQRGHPPPEPPRTLQPRDQLFSDSSHWRLCDPALRTSYPGRFWMPCVHPESLPALDKNIHACRGAPKPKSLRSGGVSVALSGGWGVHWGCRLVLHVSAL